MKESTVDELERQLEESQGECTRYRRVLERAVDRLAEIGLIDSSPYARRLFVSGEREF